MNKDMGKRRILRICLLLLLTTILGRPGSGRAAWSITDDLSFRWETDGQTIEIRLMEIRNNQLALYLPGGCDGKLQAALTGSEEAGWDGRTLKNGDGIDVSPWIGKTAELQLRGGAKTTTVQVMRGSPIPALFFRITEADWKRIHSNRRFDIKEEMSLIMLDKEGKTEVSDQLTSFHMHGNSTVFGYKKPYQFKLGHKASLEGMGKGKTWMLLANWFDISLIRNQMTFDLCREMGLSGTPDCRQADVYFNGEYNGTYLLTEKIQLRKGRLEIADMEEELEALNGSALADAKRKASSRHSAKAIKYFEVEEPEDITGGFLLEIEKALHFSKNEKNAGFVTDGQMCIVIKEPSQPGLQAVDYIAGVVNDFHNAVLAKNGTSPATGKKYSEYIDMHSFAAKIIIEEFSANYDVRAGSQFLYKDSDRTDSRIYAGPGWDYDLTYGNKEDGLLNPVRKDYVFNRSSTTSQLYHYLLTHADFTAYTRSVFEKELVPAAEILLGKRKAPEGSQIRPMKEYHEAIADSAEMNYTRWNAKLVPDIIDRSGRTYEDAENYLEDWISQRFGMMKSEWLTGK